MNTVEIPSIEVETDSNTKERMLSRLKCIREAFASKYTEDLVPQPSIFLDITVTNQEDTK